MTQARGLPKNAEAWTLLGQKRLEQIIKKSRKPVRQVNLTLLGAPAMKRLNQKYRGKNYVTDVLSFPAPAPIRKIGFIGELVICLPVLKAQARGQKHSPLRELDVLLVHGFLHLMGFDHEKGPKEAARMARAEKRLLGRVGLIERSQSGKA
jgi:rRNA maturation RNase YbeY